MKSTQEQLKKRGKMVSDDLDPFLKFRPADLIGLLSSTDPERRTRAAVSLGKYGYAGELETARALTAALKKEKALYTKIAICEALALGGEITVNEMMPHLGLIGNNQHRSIPSDVSKKKSYPLPRDIIARTLGNMPAECGTVIIWWLDKEKLNRNQLLEHIKMERVDPMIQKEIQRSQTLIKIRR